MSGAALQLARYRLCWEHHKAPEQVEARLTSVGGVEAERVLWWEEDGPNLEDDRRCEEWHESAAAERGGGGGAAGPKGPRPGARPRYIPGIEASYMGSRRSWD